MNVTDRLRRLDQRAEAAFGVRLKRNYDIEPPMWLKYGGIAYAFLGPLTIPLSIATSPALVVVALTTVLLVYLLFVVSWVVRHRL